MAVCYIVGAAEGFVPFVRSDEDLVIAADGGCRHLRRAGITPDLVVGDMDSCDRLPAGVPVERHPVRKDETDTALALRIGRERGYRSFVILGAVGGREDHTFANYSLLLDAKEQGMDAVLRSPSCDVRVVKDECLILCGNVGDTVSLFAIGGAAQGITLQGFSYPLTDATLTPQVPLGVSNVLTAADARISVRCGALLCFHMHGL